MSRFPFRPLWAALAVPLALSACSTKKKEPPPCPPIYILSDAKSVTKYRPGPGRDLTDVDVDAEIVGWNGDCAYKEKKDKADGWNVNVDLQVSIEAKRGPANVGRKAELTYFVAIPAFYPKDEAKAEFPVTIEFPEGVNSVRHVDEPVHLTIPVKQKDLIDNYEIYLGFQTTAAELEHNRSGK